MNRSRSSHQSIFFLINSYPSSYSTSTSLFSLPSSSSSSNTQMSWSWLNSFIKKKLNNLNQFKISSSSSLRERTNRKLKDIPGTNVDLKNHINTFMSSYEDLIGIRQVKDAQGLVLQAEIRFAEAQESRRRAQNELNNLELKLREVRYDLERTPRGEEHYLDLVKREMGLIREERTLRLDFERNEKEERDLFGGLSSALRASHEKERAQSEKTKYWSIFGSIIGAMIGFIGTTISSRLKMNELKNLVTDVIGSHEQTEDRLLHKIISNVNSNLNSLFMTHHNNTNNNDEDNKVKYYEIWKSQENGDIGMKTLRKELFISTTIITSTIIIISILYKLFSS